MTAGTELAAPRGYELVEAYLPVKAGVFSSVPGQQGRLNQDTDDGLGER